MATPAPENHFQVRLMTSPAPGNGLVEKNNFFI
jgi:hypothetical protein